METRISFPIPPNILDITLASLPVMIGLLASVMRLSDYVRSGSFLKAANLSPRSDTFDFIVVGGGSAGSVIANRLSENRNIRVLLLEAGGDPNPYTYIPTAIPKLQNNPATDWEYKTVPQNNCAYRLVKQEVAWPRGKDLGGSSNINFMIYMRGNRRDFDRWGDHTNSSHWRYENVERYFRKMEDYDGHWTNNGYHSKGGPLRIEKVPFQPGLNYVLDAAKEMGFEIRDMNGDQKEGFSPLDMTMKRGMRFGTFRAYLKPILRRRNLVVHRYSFATKIHIDDNHRATGVTYLRHGVQVYAEARKEIIVSAGAVNSAQLLMLSGIGPRAHLIENRIPPVVDLPVGLNMQDHVTTVIGPFLLNQSASLMLHRDVDVGSMFKLLSRGTGPLTSPMGIMGVGMSTTSLGTPNWPDMMYTVAGVGVFNGFPKLIDELFNSGNTAEIFLTPDLGNDSHFVLITLGLPESRGYIRLNDNNPFSKPIINPQYFSDSNGHDIQAMVEGIALILNLYENTTSLQKLGARLSRALPGCEQESFKSTSYFECLARSLTLSLYHPSGTCSMGNYDDDNAVVDPRLRVKGVKGLRVADTSVMPYVTNANTNAPTIVIGEICADMIKEEWKLSDGKYG